MAISIGFWFCICVDCCWKPRTVKLVHLHAGITICRRRRCRCCHHRHRLQRPPTNYIRPIFIASDNKNDRAANLHIADFSVKFIYSRFGQNRFFQKTVLYFCVLVCVHTQHTNVQSTEYHWEWVSKWVSVFAICLSEWANMKWLSNSFTVRSLVFFPPPIHVPF